MQSSCISLPCSLALQSCLTVQSVIQSCSAVCTLAVQFCPLILQSSMQSYSWVLLCSLVVQGYITILPWRSCGTVLLCNNLAMQSYLLVQSYHVILLCSLTMHLCRVLFPGCVVLPYYLTVQSCLAFMQSCCVIVKSCHKGNYGCPGVLYYCAALSLGLIMLLHLDVLLCCPMTCATWLCGLTT